MNQELLAALLCGDIQVAQALPPVLVEGGTPAAATQETLEDVQNTTRREMLPMAPYCVRRGSASVEWLDVEGWPRGTLPASEVFMGVDVERMEGKDRESPNNTLKNKSVSGSLKVTP